MRQPPHLLVPCLLLMAISAPATLIAGAEVYQRNWPQWRGPARNGLVLHGNPPLEWSEEQNVKWKVSIPGRGHATPIIWEDKIVLLTAVPMSTEPGATAEESPVPAAPAAPRPRGGPGQRRGGGDGMAPATDYAFTVICLDRSTGKTLWQRVERQERPHQGVQPSNSFSSASPVTDGERQGMVAMLGARIQSGAHGGGRR